MLIWQIFTDPTSEGKNKGVTSADIEGPRCCVADGEASEIPQVDGDFVSFSELSEKSPEDCRSLALIVFYTALPGLIWKVSKR